jgi:hypothetical protein
LVQVGLCNRIRMTAIDWYVAQTVQSQEAKCIERIERLGYATWLPLFKGSARRGRKRIQLELPLFPTYFFTAVQ